MKYHSHNSKEKGFALLFAVLISSVLLSIGISIFNLTLKELVLSSSGRESQFAFYSADTGVECALYWESKGTEIFAWSFDSSTTRTPVPANPDCIGQAVTINNFVGTLDSTQASTRFTLTIPNPGGISDYCAIVTVTKEDVAGVIETTIDSRGYNTPCASTDPNRVERALKVTY